jgi:hypothetical protein
MGERGLAFVSEHYDFDRYLQQLEALLARVSGETTTASAGRP